MFAFPNCYLSKQGRGNVQARKKNQVILRNGKFTLKQNDLEENGQWHFLLNSLRRVKKLVKFFKNWPSNRVGHGPALRKTHYTVRHQPWMVNVNFFFTGLHQKCSFQVNDEARIDTRN